MKLKAMFLSLVTVLSIGLIAHAVTPLEAESAQASIQETVITQPEAPQEPVVVEEVKDTNKTIEIATVTSEAVTAPVILSIQEYAEMYLDVASPMSQECFDNIVNLWPERFTPEVREKNIKGLKSWASPCATQMMPNRNPKSTLIYSYGANGEYFDSELAKRNW